MLFPYYDVYFRRYNKLVKKMLSLQYATITMTPPQQNNNSNYEQHYQELCVPETAYHNLSLTNWNLCTNFKSIECCFMFWGFFVIFYLWLHIIRQTDKNAFILLLHSCTKGVNDLSYLIHLEILNIYVYIMSIERYRV